MALFIKEWIIHINNIVSEHISPYLADSGLIGFFALYPIYILIMFFVLAGGFALFVDFIKDAWKIPLAIIGDILDIMAMQYPGLFDVIDKTQPKQVICVHGDKPDWFAKDIEEAFGIKAYSPKNGEIIKV